MGSSPILLRQMLSYRSPGLPEETAVYIRAIAMDPTYVDEQAARRCLEAFRWQGRPSCPGCGQSERVTGLNGTSHRAGLYQCNVCRDHFTVVTDTIMRSTKVPLHKWLLATNIIDTDNPSIVDLQVMLGLTYKTTWSLARKIHYRLEYGRRVLDLLEWASRPGTDFGDVRNWGHGDEGRRLTMRFLAAGKYPNDFRRNHRSTGRHPAEILTLMPHEYATLNS